MKRRSIKRRAVTTAVTFAIAGLTVGAAIAGHGFDRSSAIEHAIDDGRARNVIFLLGDGMGDSEVTIARNYAVGASGRFAGLDALTFTGESTTWSVQEDDPTKPEYVTDSAAAATAWATGHKTANGRISTSPGTDLDWKTILEIAQDRGYATGNVSNADITDATPAALDSHVADRDCYGPIDTARLCPQDLKSAGGPGSIAEQTIDHRVDVVLGGGKSRFDQLIPAGEPNAGKTVLQLAADGGYQVATTRDAMLAAPSGKKLLGLFSSSHMTTEWNGAVAKAYPGSGPQRCDETYRSTVAPSQPSLPEMTAKAIELLDKKTRGRRQGFFLQVEGALIDKQDHAQNPCGQIGDTVAFDQAIQIALAYAKKHPDTLLVITADHAQTSQIISAPQSASHHSPGAFSVLTTADGVDMVVNYATTMPGTSQDHTGTQVSVSAEGPQAYRALGVNDETDLFGLMNCALGSSWSCRK